MIDDEKRKLIYLNEKLELQKRKNEITDKSDKNDISYLQGFCKEKDYSRVTEDQ